MNMAVSFPNPGSLYHGNRRIVIGIAASFALHALFLLAYRDTGLSTMETAPAEPTTIAITIAPPVPAPAPPMPEPPPVTRTAPSEPVAAAPTPRPAPPKAVIAVPENSSSEPDPFVVEQAATPEQRQEQEQQPAPVFDMNAARQVARANAHLRDPAKEGTALAQFPEPPLQTESKLARGIAGAKRPNCKDGLPGGLLAPIFLLMEKKDSGCKW